MWNQTFCSLILKIALLRCSFNVDHSVHALDTSIVRRVSPTDEKNEKRKGNAVAMAAGGTVLAGTVGRSHGIDGGCPSFDISTMRAGVYRTVQYTKKNEEQRPHQNQGDDQRTAARRYAYSVLQHEDEPHEPVPVFQEIRSIINHILVSDLTKEKLGSDTRVHSFRVRETVEKHRAHTACSCCCSHCRPVCCCAAHPSFLRLVGVVAGLFYRGA